MQQKKQNETKTSTENELLHLDECKQEEVNISPITVCSCVKCSILYHEALIKGITDINAILCNKCNNKLVACKCCSSLNNACANSIPSPVQQQILENKTKEDDINASLPKSPNLEEKLFSIKHELVSLSETSLDVFELLLQLSDTMLELNTQLNTSANSNRLFNLNNSNHKSSLNSSKSLLEEEEEEEEDNVDEDNDLAEADVEKKANNSKANSVSNIISTLNNKISLTSPNSNNNSNSGGCKTKQV